MGEKNDDFDNAKIVVRQLLRKDAPNLIDAGFPFNNGILRRSVRYRLYQRLRLTPHEIGMVAYHTQKNRALGYLSLMAHTNSLYSIKYVFSDPNFRRMGVATNLLKKTLFIAKKKGARKVFLTTYPNSAAARLYKKLGFKRITETYMVKGGGYTSTFLPESQDSFVALQNLQSYNRHLYNIYARSLGQDWIDFFETSCANLKNGYSQDFKRFFLKSYFIDNSADLFAMVFKHPLSSAAHSELYGASDSFFPHRLRELMNILHKRGIDYLSITLFNVRGNACLNLLREKRFYPYQAVFMGKSL
jgi:ribosomal protein S18 acetylase RimI-like enzyme